MLSVLITFSMSLQQIIFLQPLVLIILQITIVFFKERLIYDLWSVQARETISQNISFFYYQWMFVYQTLLLWLRKYLMLRRVASPNKCRWQCRSFRYGLDLCGRRLKLHVPSDQFLVAVQSTLRQTDSNWGFHTTNLLFLVCE